jgi:hypothetical protein
MTGNGNGQPDLKLLAREFRSRLEAQLKAADTPIDFDQLEREGLLLPAGERRYRAPGGLESLPDHVCAQMESSGMEDGVPVVTFRPTPPLADKGS